MILYIHVFIDVSYVSFASIVSQCITMYHQCISTKLYHDVSNMPDTWAWAHASIQVADTFIYICDTCI